MINLQPDQHYPKPDRWSFLWLLLGMLLSLFSFGYWVIPLAAWLTNIFSLRFLRTQPLWRGFGLMVVFAMAVNAYAGADMIPMPFPLSIGLIALQVLLGSLPFLADRWLVPRLPGFAGTLVLPLAATAWEFLNLTNSPLGSFGSVAYANYGNLPLMQLVSITGIWGITFLMYWCASMANWAWERAFEPRRIWRGVGAYTAIFALVLIYGNARLLFTTEPTPQTVRMAGITLTTKPLAELFAIYERDVAAFRAETGAIHEQYLAATEREARAGARLVNWPEGAGIGLAADVEALVQQGQNLAQAEGIYLAMPTFKLFPDEQRPAENRLYVADPKGNIVVDHVKYGGNYLEGTLLGDGNLQTVATPLGLLTGVICWDADFVGTMRQAGQRGVDLMIVGANDWRGINAVHAQMAVFRAIENGMALFRQASNGTSIAVDPYGRVLTSLDYFITSEQVIVAQMPINAGVTTIYSRIGDSLGWATVIGFVIMLVWGIINRRKAYRTEAIPSDQALAA